MIFIVSPHCSSPHRAQQWIVQPDLLDQLCPTATSRPVEVTVDFFGVVGVLLKAQGRLAESEPHYRETLEIQHRVLGREHPSTLTSINNMGMFLIAQRRTLWVCAG